jgi:hypothetical protein
MSLFKKIKEFFFPPKKDPTASLLSKEEHLEIFNKAFKKAMQEARKEINPGDNISPTGRIRKPYTPPPHALPRRVDTKPKSGNHPGWRSSGNTHSASFAGSSPSSSDPMNAAYLGYMVGSSSSSSSRSDDSSSSYSSSSSSSYDSGSSCDSSSSSSSCD